MTLGAIVCTAIAWFIGLLIKVNWTPGLSLDVLLPILTMVQEPSGIIAWFSAKSLRSRECI